MKPRLGYIDHSFHKKTRSTYFLRDILSEQFEVVDVWDESWNGGGPLLAEDINAHNFDCVVFFQSLPSHNELQKIQAKMMYIPMYDSVYGRGRSFWLELSTVPIKILSFSATLSEIIRQCGLEVLTVQYFFDPMEFHCVDTYVGNRLFFWQRTDFAFPEVKRIIGNQIMERCVLKIDPDPGYRAVLPTEEDMVRYNITLIRGSISREEYLDLLQQSNIFVSSRKTEGIGMSFLEAMSSGLMVVATDRPTMNEYIRDGENGRLLIHGLREIDFSQREAFGRQSRELCKSGYALWKESEKDIIRFLLSDQSQPKSYQGVYWRCIKLIRVFYALSRKFGIYFEPL